MRSAVLNTPEVIAHLLSLDELRRQWRESPNRGKMREAKMGDETVLAAADYPDRRRYESALEASPLCALFTVGYLDHRVSVIRRRLDEGAELGINLWGSAIPVDNKGAGYGRRRGAHPSMDPETIELAVADLVREHLGGPQHPHLDRTQTLRSKVRQYRRRLRQLAVS